MTDSDPAAAPASTPSSAPTFNATQPAAGPPLDKSVGAIVVSIVVSLLTLGFGLLFVWPVTMVWAAVTASKKHQEFEEWKIGKLAGGANHGVA